MGLLYQVNTITNKTQKIDKNNETNLTTQKIYTIPTNYGINADKRGFLDSKINELMGIPSDMKIHITTMEAMSKYVQKKTDSNFNRYGWYEISGVVLNHL